MKNRISSFFIFQICITLIEKCFSYSKNVPGRIFFFACTFSKFLVDTSLKCVFQCRINRYTEWTSWDAWGDCFGSILQTRRRRCVYRNQEVYNGCDGDSTESRCCNTNTCPGQTNITGCPKSPLTTLKFE